MLLANMVKSDDIKRILTLTRDVPKPLTTSNVAIDELMDCFVKGAQGSYNPKADFDYLAYLFADIAKVCPVSVSVSVSKPPCRSSSHNPATNTMVTPRSSPKAKPTSPPRPPTTLSSPSAN